MRESAAASHIRLFAAKNAIELWRNNVGVLLDETGRPVRYGLANESAQLNMRVKSSDYIGITPVYITERMLGRIAGIFTAVETKNTDWQFRASDERAVAQKAFHDIVRRAGGRAGFARDVQEFREIAGI